jgi:hypothetical protein
MDEYENETNIKFETVKFDNMFSEMFENSGKSMADFNNIWDDISSSSINREYS